MPKRSAALLPGTLFAALVWILASQSLLEAQVNPNSTDKTRELLTLLKDLPNRQRVISGHCGTDASSTSTLSISPVDTVASATGKWVGILSYEYGNWSYPAQVMWQEINPLLI